MSAITQSRHDALVQALKNVFDSQPGDRDSAYNKLATELMKSVATIAFGAGDPSDSGVVEVATFYYDTSGNVLWQKQGTWKKFTAV